MSLPASDAPAAARSARRPAAAALLPWIVLALLAAFPFVAPSLGLEYYIAFVRRLLIFMIAAASLNFILGYGGMVALGHAGFVGVGAYTVVAMADAGHDAAWLMWLAAALVAALVALAIGAISLRTRGVYFIMITLAFAQMLYYVAVSWRTYGGDDGYGIYAPVSLGWFAATGSHALYWAVLLLAAAVFWLLSRLSASRFGHALKGIRDNETRMSALGYPVYRLKLAAFVTSAALAGLAGALLAVNNAFVSPSIMHWTESAALLVMVVVGGLGYRWGPVIGVGLWLTLVEVLRMYTDYWHWPMGVLLLAIVFFAPRGIAAWFDRRRSNA
ncbi:branched-chain amino acid ABC transporter permease [Verticiella sediminum]|uniref:Branched-chain amino acid ABC transporter permease n=1 Tax=Verticiella sediminum TaxID=1247510 RepID=A0A556AIH4_9BURK|nr:branched-chain amino acid ABC transporter permease [Verticiella sediminum]TSH92702.1 branched-chain amino acid ABC transporter permease [Verticiella sediminum]